MIMVATGDLHSTGKTPRARLDSLPQALWLKRDEILQICRDHEAKFLLLPGDVFDYPYQSYQTFIEVWRWMGALDDNGTEVLAVYGQHDLWHHSLETASNTALGALANVEVVKILGADPYRKGNFHFYGASWEEEIPSIVDLTKVNILLIHKTISPKKPWGTAKEGVDYVSPEVLYDKDWFDFVVCGDWHGQFYWRSKADTHILNPGALARKTGGYEDYDRHPSIVLWDTDENDVEEVLLDSAKPSEEILTREQIEVLVKHTKRMKDFTSRLKAGGGAIGPKYMVHLVVEMNRLRKEGALDSDVESRILETIEASTYKDLLSQELARHGKEKEKPRRRKKVIRAGR